MSSTHSSSLNICTTCKTHSADGLIRNGIFYCDIKCVNTSRVTASTKCTWCNNPYYADRCINTDKGSFCSEMCRKLKHQVRPPIQPGFGFYGYYPDGDAPTLFMNSPLVTIYPIPKLK